MSFNLWLPERFFPLLPIFAVSYYFNLLIGWSALLVLIVSLFFTALNRSRVWLILSVVSIITLIFLDQTRLQPWVYIYIAMLVCLAIGYGNRQSEDILLSCVQVICIGVYLWSGIHKINAGFLDNTFKLILETLFFIKNRDLSVIKKFGYLIPTLEIICGLSLFFSRTRTVGICISIALHLAILVFVGPLGINRNQIVIPWNVAMIPIVFISFYKTENDIFRWDNTSKLKIVKLIIFILFWVMPFFNFLSLWDSYLSFSLYSDKVNKYFIAIEQTEINKIDKRLNSYFVELPNLRGGNLIEVDKWAMSDLNVPFYPEDRVFKQLSESFCKLGIDNEKLIFLKVSNYPRRDEYIPFKCK